ncbi:MAG TPA: hypothetical protein VER98_02345 [Terriglobia bacterium]|nr:hypothetical protein [Terriglobia bacterium]
MLGDVLREGFRLALRGRRFIFLDLLWKAIWFVFTVGALLLVAAWFFSELRSIGWGDTGNRAVNGAVGFALMRQFWAVHRTQIFGAVATVLFLSLIIWFLLEAAFRARLHSPPRIRIFLLSNVLKCLVITNAAVAVTTISLGRYLITPPSQWPQLWPETRGAAIAALVTLAALGFLLTILDTLIRSDAIELLGTDLFRVIGLIGILVLFEAMISGSCAVMIGVGFLSIAGWKNALMMLGTAAVMIVFINVLHSYLLVVRFSALGIMRQNVGEI